MAIIGTDIEYAVNLLKKGKLVGIPTDTVYGLAANGYDAEAIRSIYIVKNRPMTKALIAQTDSIDKVKTFVAEWPKGAEKLASKYWPGELTLVLKSKGIRSEMLAGGHTVGVRIPNHKMTLALLSRVDFPLAVPSANIHGEESPIDAQGVNIQLGNKIEYILDGGPCEIGFESTIVGFENDEPVIYREGAISKQEIFKTLK